MKWLNSALKASCSAGALLAVSYLIYDVTAFQWRRPAIEAVLAARHPQDRSPPEALRRLLMIETEGHLDFLVARQLGLALHVEPVTHSALGSHLTSALWTSLVRLHLTRDEKLAIYCSRAYLGRRAFGFQAGAQAFFGRDLATLKTGELALLVIYTRSPGRYSLPEYASRAAQARDALLARLSRS